MKKAFWVIILLPFFAFRCEKDVVPKCFKGKIIRITCASYVIQALDQDIGDDQWTDSTGGGQVYDNVFSVSNKCQVPASFQPGDNIYFDLQNPSRNDCVVCAMYDAPPRAKFHIKNVSSVPCP